MTEPGNHEKKVKVADIMVSYTDTGKHKTPTLVFIHGFPFNKAMWEGQSRALADTCRVIAFDLRGHGETDAGRENISINGFSRDLIGFMDALELQEVMLCGLSMGGYIALNAISRHPERFSALILSDTQCIADSPEGKKKRMLAIEKIKKQGVDTYADESLANLFSRTSLASQNSYVESIKEMIRGTSRHTLCDTLLALANREETCSSLSSILVPTLILVGEEDKITPPSAAEFMHKRIKGSELVVIPGSGHLPNLENPSVFNTKLREFVQRAALTEDTFAPPFSES
jgi:pimeloyl-ACP methyl ester carboxylesterase